MKTFDGVNVKKGSTVWVFGSTGIQKTKVLEPVTSYEFFGPIPVSQSFSSREAAEKHYNKKAGK